MLTMGESTSVVHSSQIQTPSFNYIIYKKRWEYSRLYWLSKYLAFSVSVPPDLELQLCIITRGIFYVSFMGINLMS